MMAVGYERHILDVLGCWRMAHGMSERERIRGIDQKGGIIHEKTHIVFTVSGDGGGHARVSAHLHGDQGRSCAL